MNSKNNGRNYKEMIYNMKKSSLILALMIAASCLGVQAAQDTITDKGDKYITVSRSEDWTFDEKTTFAIANVSGIKNSGRDITWDEITDKALSNPNIIAYYNTGVVNENVKYKNGDCEFNIVLDKSGIYKCFLSDQSGNTDIFYINHIDEAAQRSATDSIILSCDNKETAVADIANILKNNTYDFGFGDDLYLNVVSGTNNNENNVAQYIYDYVCGDIFNKDGENYSEILCGAVLRAFAAESLNMGITKDLYDIEYAMGTQSLKLEDYVKKDHSDILNAKMAAKKYTSIADYDKALIETFTGLAIQYNDGTGEIPAIIKQFANVSGIDTSKVTDAFCNSIAGSDGYYSFDAIKAAAQNFVEPSNTDTGKGTGSKKGGSSSGGGSGKISPVTADDNVDIKNDTSGGVNIFADVPKDHWANTYIETLYKEGVVSGVSTTDYNPEANVTREEFVKLIVSALKLNTVGSGAPFTDVDPNAWYADFINIAYNSEIVNGISDTEFGTGVNISRQDIAVMVLNALKVIDYSFADGGDLTFADSAYIDSYAAEAVKMLKNSGILSGDNNNMFNPKQNATRAEAAKIIYMISR